MHKSGIRRGGWGWSGYALLGVCLVSLAASARAADDLVWTRSIGGAGIDDGRAIAVDGDGSVYVTGQFGDTIDADSGALTPVGETDIFLRKFDTAGDIVWTRALGGAMEDSAESIAVDDDGNVYLTGWFEGTIDADPGPSVETIVSAGRFDILIQKLDRDGNFVWARGIGGTNFDRGRSVALDGDGNVYVTGEFAGSVPVALDSGVTTLSTVAGRNLFVLKLDNDGTGLWAQQLQSWSHSSGWAITVDDEQNVYGTGYFEGWLFFDPEDSAQNFGPAGVRDIFVFRLASDGRFLWAKGIGGRDFGSGRGIALDDAGGVYTTGTFHVADFDPGPAMYELATQGRVDMFLSKLSNDGDFVWAKQIGGDDAVNGISLAIDGAGRILVAGICSGTTDFDPGPGIASFPAAGDYDAFVLQLTGEGDYLWARTLGGAEPDLGYAIAIDDDAGVYVTGVFGGTALFGSSETPAVLVAAGATDAFVCKLATPAIPPELVPGMPVRAWPVWLALMILGIGFSRCKRVDVPGPDRA